MHNMKTACLFAIVIMQILRVKQATIDAWKVNEDKVRVSDIPLGNLSHH